MTSSTKLSIVLPVRNGQNRIERRLEKVLVALAELGIGGAEIVIVDDGSSDATPRILDNLCTRFSRVRVMRHPRPRGMEAAGQTGLERATGDLIFIQESDADLRIDDLRRLLKMSDDPTVIAARAESAAEPASPELIRRLRAFGTHADRQVIARTDTSHQSSLQMVRRPHLQVLAGPHGDRYHLESDSSRSVSIELS
ncbi:putative glycosyltransferase EpsH [Rubripirellula tenax]|uniref:Putative glycosyltransferase EpsH n=1 Tax=Rubripirellula tenax TaxID=2528015 RepID=A0A5C6FE72_9BACT|nr:glycosyltransferase family 2 protein [Rubripirellula tenax]TWU58494.1 putative glycosyltransferase EpsH [Rubripirellula tenax]